jgi:hypothetical protein
MTTSVQRAFVAMLASVALWGCGGGASGNAETAVAGQVTKAIYDNDVAGVTQNFSSALSSQVTRASVGTLSDKMHALGNYQGVTETQTDIPNRRYMFDAKFDHGDMTIGMRLDAEGKVIAYRVVPGVLH